MNLRERATRLKVDVPTVFLALNDHDTPLIAKIFAGITVAYALSPIDLIPDFIPVLGYLDDLLLLPALIALTLKLIPREVSERCRRQAEHLWEAGTPKKWVYAVPVLLVWMIFLWVAVKTIFL